MRYRSILCVLAAFLLSSCGDGQPPPLSSISSQQVSTLTGALRRHDRVELATKADASLSGMMKFAALALNERGFPNEAAQITQEWKAYAGYLPLIVRMAEAKGDYSDVPELYQPLSLKLAQWYHLIAAALGPELTERLHLDDIQVINFGTPAVLRLAIVDDANPDAETYALYWNPWCGVLAYWGSWAACEAATYGSGWFVICTPIATVTEKITVNYVAPRFSDRAWRYFYGR